MPRIIITLCLALACVVLLCSWTKPFRSRPPMPVIPKKVCRPIAGPPMPIVPAAPLSVILEKPPFKKKKVIVIDAGHGGDDLGTQSTTKPRYKEKHLNLATAKLLEVYLQKMGYHIIMTRSDDTFIALEKRAGIANNIKSDLFVSVHYNSAPAKQAEGVEVFFYRDDSNKERVSSSKQLALLVLNKIIENTEAKSRGVKHGDLSVIRNTKMPAILVEGGFLTNDDEMKKLKNPEYLKRVAWGIAQGIQAYIEGTGK